MDYFKKILTSDICIPKLGSQTFVVFFVTLPAYADLSPDTHFITTHPE
jgi:hypothetical protein